MIYGHGSDAYRYGGKIQMDFSSNVFTHADHSQLLKHLGSLSGVLNTYTEPEPLELERMIAEEQGLQPQSVMVTAGVTEAIYLIAQLYQGYASIIPQPAFCEYEEACKTNGHTVSYYDNDEMEVLPEQRLYWLCNPSNPTGAVMLRSLMTYVVRHHQQYVFVIDQSLAPFTRQEPLRYADMQDCHNLILLHSLSKRFCAPGLRLGYITASPIIIDRLRLLRRPWSVSALDNEAGKYLLQHHYEPLADREAYLEEARRLHAELANTEGLMLMDSDSNIMLAYLNEGDAPHMKNWLIENHGILIRDASNFHGLDSHCFRVSAQYPKENDLLVQAIREYLRGTSRHFTKYW